MTETNGHKMETKETESKSIDGSLSHEEEEQVPKGGLQVEGFDVSRRRKRRRWLCGCCLSCGVVVIVLAIIIIVLALTVFKPKEPKISINSVTIDGFSVDVAGFTVHLNFRLTSDMSMKNTNKAASFKHGNGTTFFLYDGKTVGQAAIPPGNLQADRTSRMNVSATVFVDVIVSDLIEVIGDIYKGSLNMTSRTEMAGRVNVLHLIKKHVKVVSLCDITVDLSSQRAEMHHCKYSFKL